MDVAKENELIAKLLNLTRRDKLEWEPTAIPETFLCAFPSYSIILKKNGPLFINLEVIDSSGDMVDTVSPTQPLLHELYAEIRKRVDKSGKAVDDLLAELNRLAS